MLECRVSNTESSFCSTWNANRRHSAVSEFQGGKLPVKLLSVFIQNRVNFGESLGVQM